MANSMPKPPCHACDEMRAVVEAIKAAEIKLSDRCLEAKQHWQRMAKENHENAYAACVRYETLRMAADMIADIGELADRIGESEG